MKLLMLLFSLFFAFLGNAQDFLNPNNLWLYKGISMDSQLFYKYEWNEPIQLNGETVYPMEVTKIEFYGDSDNPIRQEEYFHTLLFKELIDNVIYIYDEFGSGNYEFFMELGGEELLDSETIWTLSHYGSSICEETEFSNLIIDSNIVDTPNVNFNYVEFIFEYIDKPNYIYIANIGPLIGGFEICYLSCEEVGTDACVGYPEGLVYWQDEQHSHVFDAFSSNEIDRILYGTGEESTLTSTVWVLDYFDFNGQTYDPPQNDITLQISSETITTTIQNTFTANAVMVDAGITNNTLNYDEYGMTGDWPTGMAEYEFEYFSFFLYHFPIQYEITSSQDGRNANNLILTNNLGYQAFYHPQSLSVKEQELLQFKIYPNPVKDILKVESEEIIDNIEIYSVEGKLLLTQNNPEVNLAQLPSGTYIIVVSSEVKSVSKKFIKE